MTNIISCRKDVLLKQEKIDILAEDKKFHHSEIKKKDTTNSSDEIKECLSVILKRKIYEFKTHQ